MIPTPRGVAAESCVGHWKGVPKRSKKRRVKQIAAVVPDNVRPSQLIQFGLQADPVRLAEGPVENGPARSTACSLNPARSSLKETRPTGSGV
jgi:hypothetical protein